jgi:cyclohexanone monooxygenase
VTESRKRGASTLEPTAEAEADYVKLIRSLARLGERFYMECTPGYYNSEGAPGNRHGFFSETYGAGSVKFFELLDNWRTEGSMKGIALG